MPSKYEIGSGLSDQDLKYASWWVRNAPALRRYGYGALIVLSVLFWGYGLWTALDTYAISYPREQRITRIIATDQVAPAALTASAPQPIQIGNISVLDNTGNRKDIAAQIANVNQQWWVEFTYKFDLGSEQTPERKAFLLPNSQRYLTELGIATPIAGNANPIIENIQWHRVDPKSVEKNYDAWMSKRMQLTFNDIAYANNVLINNVTAGQSTFTVNNPSSYGFWSVELTIILYRDSAPAAVNTITLNDIKPGESRPITTNWFENPMYITRTEIIPSVNILDPSVYLPASYF